MNILYIYIAANCLMCCNKDNKECFELSFDASFKETYSSATPIVNCNDHTRSFRRKRYVSKRGGIYIYIYVQMLYVILSVMLSVEIKDVIQMLHCE